MAIDRRGLLIGGAAIGGGLAIGAVGRRAGWWEADILGGSDPNAAIRRLARAREAALVRAYDQALAVGGPAQAQLRLYGGQHNDHLQALGGSADEAADAEVLPVPADPAAFAGFFTAQERDWATDTETAVRISPDGGLARLFALICASETTHVWGWTHG
jgi:hypothetical protein